MGRLYLSLPKYTKEIKQLYQGQSAPEQYAPVDGAQRKFLSLLKQPSIGALDLLFTRIPKCFGTEEASSDLVAKIRNAKLFFDQAKTKLEDALIQDVKLVFSEASSSAASLSSVIADWYENLSSAVKSKLYPNGAERLFSVIDKATNDEHLLVEGLARVLTGLRIEDWNDNSIRIFKRQLTDFKSVIDDENARAADESDHTLDDVPTQYSVVFIDDNGNAVQRTFERVERSKRSNSLYNRINNAIRETGQSVSPQEKRQILMEILEKLC